MRSSGVEIFKGSKLKSYSVTETKQKDKLTLIFETEYGHHEYQPELTFTSIPLVKTKHSPSVYSLNSDKKTFSIYISTKKTLSLKNTYLNIYKTTSPFTRLTPTNHENGHTGCVLEGLTETSFGDDKLIVMARNFLISHELINDMDIISCNIITRPHTFLTSGKNSKKYQLPKSVIPIGRLNNSLWFTKDLLTHTYMQVNKSLRLSSE